MFIDIHVHFHKHQAFRTGTSKLLPHRNNFERYADIKVERAVVLPEVNPECAHVTQSNEEIPEVVQQYPMFILLQCGPARLTNSVKVPFQIFSVSIKTGAARALVRFALTYISLTHWCRICLKGRSLPDSR